MTEFVDVKTQDMSGAALDWAVAKVEGDKRLQTTRKQFGLHVPVKVVPSYSTYWNHIGPLIHRYAIELEPADKYAEFGNQWQANMVGKDCDLYFQSGDTPLIAACRAIVASVLGDTVSVPKELMS